MAFRVVAYHREKQDNTRVFGSYEEAQKEVSDLQAKQDIVDPDIIYEIEHIEAERDLD